MRSETSYSSFPKSKHFAQNILQSKLCSNKEYHLKFLGNNNTKRTSFFLGNYIKNDSFEKISKRVNNKKTKFLVKSKNMISSHTTLFRGSESEYDPVFPNIYSTVLTARRNSTVSAKIKAKSSQENSNQESEVRLKTNNLKTGIIIKEYRLSVPHTSTTKHYVSGLRAAQNNMEKFGWKPGNGLGKNEQGITNALYVRKNEQGITNA